MTEKMNPEPSAKLDTIIVPDGHAKDCPMFGMFKEGPCQCGWQDERDRRERLRRDGK